MAEPTKPEPPKPAPAPEEKEHPVDQAAQEEAGKDRAGSKGYN